MCPQIDTESIALLIATDDGVVRSLAVSPCFTQVVHWLVSLGPGALSVTTSGEVAAVDGLALSR
ncbi:MAG: hypothetical protein GY847_22890 [Proteobacteria bacterium]|nr:hypothetical protein [Pseudomonadota bacterium]